MILFITRGNSPERSEWCETFAEAHDGFVISRDKIFARIFGEVAEGDFAENSVVHDEIFNEICRLNDKYGLENIIIEIDDYNGFFLNDILFFIQNIDGFNVDYVVRVLFEPYFEQEDIQIGDDLNFWSAQKEGMVLIGFEGLEDFNLYSNVITLDTPPKSIDSIKELI